MKSLCHFIVIAGALLSVSARGDTVPKADVTPAAATVSVDKLTLANPPLFIEYDDTCAIAKDGTTENPFLLMLLGTILKPLVQVAVPAATGWLYDKGVHALEAREAKYQSSSTAVTTTTIYDPETKSYRFGCLYLIRAKRGKIDPVGTYYNDGEWSAGLAKKRMEAMQISNVPEFYMELSFDSIRAASEKNFAALDKIPGVLPKGKTSLTVAEKTSLAARDPVSLYRTIRPAKLYYLKHGPHDVRAGGAHVTVELHFDAMNDKGEWQPFYSRTFDLGKLVDKGDPVSNVISLGSDTFLPPPLRHTTDGYIDPVPLRITAVLTETDDSFDIGRTLEGAFKDSQARKTTVDSVATFIDDKIQEKIDEKLGTKPADAKK